jgi:hypothetical protein
LQAVTQPDRWRQKGQDWLDAKEHWVRHKPKYRGSEKDHAWQKETSWVGGWGCQEYGGFEKKDKPEDGNRSKLEKGSFFFGMNPLTPSLNRPKSKNVKECQISILKLTLLGNGGELAIKWVIAGREVGSVHIPAEKQAIVKNQAKQHQDENQQRR